MGYSPITDYEKYIQNAYLSTTEHTVLARVCLEPIEGITYDGILYDEICSDNKTAFVTMPFMAIDNLCTNDRLISSETTESRLITLIMTYHVFGRDYTIPMVAYLLAKTMTMKNNYEFKISSLFPREIDKLNVRLSNEDGKSVDIVAETTAVLMTAIESKEIPWLRKSDRFKIGFAVSATEDWIKKADSVNRV